MIMTEEQLFASAVEIACSDQRAAYIQQACGDDQELREKVQQLVNMHFSAGKLLDETRDGSMQDALFASVPKTGDTIGSYKLLQEIGDGGMGVVFMAEQTEPVRRKVAVKVIKLGMDTRRVIARFESERQALALMDHPCITRVLDAGSTDSGRPYFVMDLVRGKSITEYCDNKQLPLRQRLDIFVQVCSAVQHAHQKGIIHRDIKPSNIMVTSNDGVPVPKIIDFGIAKAIDQQLTEKTLFTNYGEMIGTPLYMSPEQAEMSEPDVDTRSDVYSLGVLLYELVTGSTPFDDLKEQGFHEIRQAIRSTDPVLASTRISRLGETVGEISECRNTDVESLKRFVRGELDWILAKCLARERDNRYQSAGDLAEDLQRYLNGEIVEAAKPTLVYRTRKFVRKHRAFVATAAAIGLILCTCTVVAAAMAVRARNAEQLANTRLLEVQDQRDRALKAEQRLAVLERQQRNQAAVNQAIAMHNANMVKRHIKTVQVNSPDAPCEFYVKPVSAVWNAHTAARPNVPNAPLPPAAYSRINDQTWQNGSVQVTGGQGQMSFIGNHANGTVEVVVMDDESTSQVELLKILANVQREQFGADDVNVAVTLNRLGDVMACQENWEESEKFYREAIEIVEDLSDSDRDYLPEIRMGLIDCLKDRGDAKRAIIELNRHRQELKGSRFHDRLNQMLEKLDLDELDVDLNDHDTDDADCDEDCEEKCNATCDKDCDSCIHSQSDAN